MPDCLSLSFSLLSPLWVVTVQVLHLLGLFLQSLLREQLAASRLSEKHYTDWCFNPSIFHPSSSFPHLQPLNLFSILCCFVLDLFFPADAKTAAALKPERVQLFLTFRSFLWKTLKLNITFCHSINSSCTSCRDLAELIQIWDAVSDVMRQAQLVEKKRSNSDSAAWPGNNSCSKIS